MKKIFKLSLMLSLILATSGVFAQENLPEDKPEYPRYGFWSDWSIGGDLVWAHQFPMGPLFGDGYGYGKTMGFGFDFFAQKKINHMIDIRLRAAVPYGFTWSKGTVNVDGTNRELALIGSLTADFMISINNWINGYDPECNWSVYAYLGAGAALCYNGLYNKIGDVIAGGRSEHTVAPVLDDFNYGFGGVRMSAGLGYSYALNENDHIFAEYGFDWDSDLPLPWGEWHHTNGNLRLGYYYNFGPTGEDKLLADQRAALTFSNFRSLNNQINALESQVATSRNNEKKLENRIAELEDQLTKARTANQKVVNSAAADSLQAIIDQIKADQLNYYGMPFSVQYALDEWHVSDAEMAKVNAVARVMKDNPDMRIMVVGFADKSGSDNYNMKLSERRANEVKRLLVRKGVAEDRIDVDFKGKSVAFGDSKFSINRRTSFYRVIE